MIINNVVIENFRCYYGRNEISFNNNGKITLIYGLSGFGKSSFLQFFKWMFYNEYDFGKSDDKPLWNIGAYEEYKAGGSIKLYGEIDFEHLGVKYSLTRSQEMVGEYGSKSSHVQSSHSLMMLVDDNWTEYSGDIYNKINSILPKALSKYFLLDGEKAREVVLNSKDLKQAIHSMFGIDSYANAISHIGDKDKKHSVLGQYSVELSSKLTSTVGNTNMSIQEMNENIQDLYDNIEYYKSERRNIMADAEEKNRRRDEILKTLGAAANKNTINQLIKSNQDTIKRNEQLIKDTKIEIGNLFYKWYPYMILSESASKCSSVLREKNSELATNTKDIFDNLKKDLLKEILEKDKCVCGRVLDNDTRKHIEGIINVMPPDSYTYQFGQFISKVKNQIQTAQGKFIDYEQLMSKINDLECENFSKDESNKEKLEELKLLDDAKDLVAELEQIKKELTSLTSAKAGYDGKIASTKQVYEMSKKMYNHALKDAEVSDEYNEKIETFEKIRAILEIEKKKKEGDVRDTLNSCVREIFERLTTQKELDTQNIEFVNKDFSLRTTYLTGGQLAVDEYSYVIGMVKALQECNMENNENPIIIDAPFAFTDNKQSEHIFKTLPSVSKQTVLLTLDLNKIKSLLLEDSSLYDLYILKTNSQQNRATIERGNINDIKF